jgi:hypothetical protein
MKFKHDIIVIRDSKIINRFLSLKLSYIMSSYIKRYIGYSSITKKCFDVYELQEIYRG